ncbi:hypothetical protein D9Q98_006135 [Chlorella vulgaris]|uniref:PhoD-like phosphatase domain-containing protein n=1 Tax=Chlorella vulgaris TaxID=3077 RepID=A0A9D4TWZ4_CHLVU|nr:hypothetical protein D9Q98_006135 [Chlorella vulgaris]
MAEVIEAGSLQDELFGPSPLSDEFGNVAGPFLRFQSGCGPGEEAWLGSVLILTSNGTTDPAAAPQPTLTLTDDNAGSASGTQELTPSKLDDCLGWVFWRFEIELQLAPWQRPVQYSVTAGDTTTKTYSFWLPAVGQPMHWGYTSCNGFSGSIPQDAPERQDATYLWRDMLRLHSAFPLHCLVGGGDQLYNDAVFKEPTLHAWGNLEEHEVKVAADWTNEMLDQSTRFYLENYVRSFVMEDVCDAYAQIPQVMVWDDHDLWDGYGSYDKPIQECKVFQGLFSVARRFYLLFQQHTTDKFNKVKQEFLTNDGTEFHFLKYLGPQVAVLGVDMRSQRTKARIMPPSTFALLKRTVDEMPPGTQHLVVLSGIPLIFPTVPSAESVLGCISTLSRNVRAFRGMARATGILDRFDQPELLDDLIDGWVAEVHAEERLEFIHLLQHFATAKNVRVSILSGDAHVAGVGRLYSKPKFKNIADDPLFMPQIVSSAIMNAPPPTGAVKMLMQTNWATNVDSKTRQKLVRAFYPHHPRTDKLLAARNWCDISLCAPPFAPPMVPEDPEFGGLRFVLRVENAHKGRAGHAEETYVVLAPRHPQAAKVGLATGFGKSVDSHVMLSLPSQHRKVSDAPRQNGKAAHK